MRNPTKKQLDKLIATFEKAIKKFPQASVAMMEPNINSCGTPMCHAGWFAIGAKIDTDSFTDGADVIAQTLGFEDRKQLRFWANDNPQIWGNEWGMAMFTDGKAFGKAEDEFGSLQIIIDHWKGVRDRVLALK
jgi:hypothetical protein